MKDPIRYADYLHRVGARRREIPMRELVSAPVRDADGRWQAAPHKAAKLRAGEVVAILKPYLSVRLMEQVRAVVPLALYLVLFQIIILRQLVEDSLLVAGGLFAVIVGLMLFMEGLKLGLMPFGEVIGSNLPRKLSLPVVLLVTLLLGIGVTFAEPAIGALRAAGQNVSAERAPYLWAILNQWTSELVLVVGASVGLAAVIGTLRFLYGWSLKPLIYMSLAPVLLLTVYMSSDPELAKIIGLAWDAGAVTTGPVTVPLVLALGIGIAAAAGKGGSGLSGFGIVTLASLFPVAGVMLLGLYVSAISSPAEIIAAAQSATGAGQLAADWHRVSPGLEIVSGVRAIVPLVIFLLIVLKLLLRQSLPRRNEIFLGIGLTVVGMCVFNLGLTYGLSKLGGSAGSLIPAAFMQTPGVDDSPLYMYEVGLVLALVFAWVLGYGATVAEPALNALGVTAETLTNGFIRKRSLIRAVSIGVACGIAVGVAKLVFDLPLVWLVIPPYLLAAVLTVFSSEEFVNVAWDSAGVTTGPITVPLVLAMGLGLGNATNAVEGFGILCMASVGPVISVMLLGQWARLQLWRQATATTQQPANQLLSSGEAG
ncbi:hypothetical protein ASE98_20040 [Pseudomonas sp. Leaf48]|uniref:DUF1538 domain-containing protein n=1 Tax=Pseudomonas sp. Leaf48 TaxID=1736221 RepID=UPI0007290340|nr:DUF1538 domain-containing protein [Pseudomonas sp. Leaf48]KQN53376.1 hypothetical protein ASE98_20040 [Pseudomonas sp. Leaf48]